MAWRRVFRMPGDKGLTLVEVMLSAVLISVVVMAVGALFNGTRRFYLSESDKVTIGYELRYAMEHIYKNGMQGMGDKDNPPIVITPGMSEREVVIRQIDHADPQDSPTYSNLADDMEITYVITDAGELSYSKRDLSSGTVVEEDTDMIPSVTVVYSNDPVSGEQLSRFYMDGKTLMIKLTAQFPLIRGGVRQEQKTLYGACFPRLASYN